MVACCFPEILAALVFTSWLPTSLDSCLSGLHLSGFLPLRTPASLVFTSLASYLSGLLPLWSSPLWLRLGRGLSESRVSGSWVAGSWTLGVAGFWVVGCWVVDSWSRGFLGRGSLGRGLLESWGSRLRNVGLWTLGVPGFWIVCRWIADCRSCGCRVGGLL